MFYNHIDLIHLFEESLKQILMVQGRWKVNWESYVNIMINIHSVIALLQQQRFWSAFVNLIFKPIDLKNKRCEVSI